MRTWLTFIAFPYAFCDADAMTLFTTKTILTVVMGACLALSGNAIAAQASKPAAADKKTATAATTAPTTQEISDAKAKGLVWVNTSTKVYHKDGQFYGTTKKGKFMTEADAQKEGYRAAKPSASGKKAASDATKK